MQLRSQEQKDVLLELVTKASFPGEHAEFVVELKHDIMEAEVEQATTQPELNNGTY